MPHPNLQKVAFTWEKANPKDGACLLHLTAFEGDSNVFVNSANVPTRGYSINLPLFSMTVAGRLVTIDMPQTSGTAYFVLRNNDPGVDGFFISPGTEQFFPLQVRIPGLNPVGELDFHATYGNTTTLSSLNILDAVGE